MLTMTPQKILIVDDDVRSALSLERLLRSRGYQPTLCHDGEQGLAQALDGNFDVVITDLKMPGIDGLKLVRRLHEARPRLPVILMTAFGTTETAIEATKVGAYEYLVKPFDMAEMLQIISKAATSARLAAEPVALGQECPDGQAIIGSSRAMRELYMEIGRVAARPVTVLIRGETGTGKELVARALFQHSGRADQPFIAVNCAAIPETLLESELFGHERGAFTGALAQRIGRFEQANGGTLFLDEIGDMTPFTQAKLLRVLQERYVQRLGGKQPIPVDVRIIAATHRDLEKAIADKQFREDLFYRLSSVVINLPPLRQRREDIPDLVHYFTRRICVEMGLALNVVEPEALEWIKNQSWPGNVRQLENTMRQALLGARGYPVALDHLRKVLAGMKDVSPPKATSLEDYLEELLMAARSGADVDVHAAAVDALERRLFRRAIELAQGNQAKASRWLNVSRQTMREKLLTFGLRMATEAPTPSSVPPGERPSVEA
jgi:nitrogen regulation protein NR(I)